jgi:predicted transcriptional regulator of viral defense system
MACRLERLRLLESDIERTVVDGLKQPEHCGGLTDVAKRLAMRRTDVSARKLVSLLANRLARAGTG